ncbi:MAG: hypothetical protein AAFR66_05900 [Bacteroidota bacterium]
MPEKQTDALINVHTHIFSYKDVPPFIARGFIPFPFYLLTHFSFIFGVFKLYKKWKDYYYCLQKKKHKVIGLAKSALWLNALYSGFILWITINSTYYVFDWACVIPDWETLVAFLDKLTEWNLLLPDIHILLKIIILGLGLIVNKGLRWFLLKISSFVIKPLAKLPGKNTLNFFSRYLKIASIANYKEQSTAYNKLYKMYPPGSKFVVLTMDMTYMNLTPPRSYYEQLDDIVKMMSRDNKNYQNIIPFLFVDPRRIEKDPSFFKWSFMNGEIVLEDCKLKEYVEDGLFRGIKIYPALGYYAFDERLLPL